MEFYFDTANLADIRKYGEFYPIAGVTCNPTILKKEGKVDLFSHMREIRSHIGFGKSLHMQVLSLDSAGMVAEAEVIRAQVDGEVYIKVPVTEEGLKAIGILKEKGFKVTATAIYSQLQGFLAIAAGADYIAPYVSRMENLDIRAMETVSAFAEMIRRTGSSSKVVAASFKNAAQVNGALLAGAHVVTVPPRFLHDIFTQAAVDKAVEAFNQDFEGCFGVETLLDLVP